MRFLLLQNNKMVHDDMNPEVPDYSEFRSDIAYVIQVQVSETQINLSYKIHGDFVPCVGASIS